MSGEEFIKRAVSLGYASKRMAERWCTRHERKSYAEEDFEELFRFCDACRSKAGSGVWHSVDGCRTTKGYKNTSSM